MQVHNKRPDFKRGYFFWDTLYSICQAISNNTARKFYCNTEVSKKKLTPFIFKLAASRQEFDNSHVYSQQDVGN